MPNHCIVSDSKIPWTVACQALLSMGFSSQEYGSGLPFPSPGHLPDAGIKPASPALAGGFFTTEPPGKPMMFSRQVDKWSEIPKKSERQSSGVGYNMHGCE